jgi:cytosine/adenosine deaminase-related metal-dependent hydrolase
VGSTPGTTDINRFECTQCCGSEFTYSHCNSCQEEFFRLVRERGGGIVATPETEMGMGMGAPAIRQTIDAGVPLGLGVDIVSYGAGDPFTLARLALTSGRSEECRAAVQRGEMPTKVGLTTKDALKWLTHGGATAIGLQDKIGSLEIGKSADVVLLRTDSLHMAPMHDPVTSVVMHARSSDIDTVLVEGQLRVSKGRLVGVDVSSVVKRVRASQATIFERLEKGRDEESETVKAYDALLAAKQR